MRVALDTNAYRAAAEGDAKTVEILRRAEEVRLPFVVLGELRAGFAVGTKGRANEAKLTEFLNSPRVGIDYADEQTTHHYAALFADLRRRGTPIATNDLWIAALVVQHDLLLLSADAHFAKIARIVRL
ncbi:MAG: type II toxin-antitoxin system VapC family toxin [Elusimicrobiota bacterium]